MTPQGGPGGPRILGGGRTPEPVAPSSPTIRKARHVNHFRLPPDVHHRLPLAAGCAAFECAHLKASCGQASILVARREVRAFVTAKVLNSAVVMTRVSVRAL